MPTRARRGDKLSFAAEPTLALTQARLVLLKPSGTPQELLLSREGARLSAQFYADERGVYMLQLLADETGGPRPILETLVHVGQAPPNEPLADRAPGESASRGAEGERAQLYRMLMAARRGEGLRALSQHPVLERVAQTHASRMAKRGLLQHDLGHGDPQRRLEEAGAQASRVGENLARAATPQRVHRAIWHSPSHRKNVLDAHFDAIGIGLARGETGDLYVCQLFAQGP
jgi:uncharacterized protein YkwD